MFYTKQASKQASKVYYVSFNTLGLQFPLMFSCVVFRYELILKQNAQLLRRFYLKLWWVQFAAAYYIHVLILKQNAAIVCI